MNKVFITIGWIFVVTLASIKFLSGTPYLLNIAPSAWLIILLTFCLFHGIKRYGVKSFIIFFIITFIVSWSYENLSIITGFPFGHYYYSHLLGLKLWHVPIFIMGAYFAMGYLSWTLATLLLQRNTVSGKMVFLIPLITAFIMVAWDLCTDPISSTIGKQWIWQNGGVYFGVPFVNFLGWFLCVYTIYQLFALYLKTKEKQSALIASAHYWLLAIFMYLAMFLKLPALAFFGDNKLVKSLDGRIWHTGDIYWNMTLTAIFTALFIVFLCLTRVTNKEFV